MAIENAKMLNVRIKNKYDSYENWAKSGLVLEAGEIAIAYTTVNVNVDNGTAKHPALLMKVGNGTDTFANLPWMSAKAADVLAVCKNETDLRAFINGVITDAGVATDDALKTLSTQVTTNKTDIADLKTAVGDAESGLVKAVATLNSLVGDETVAKQIEDAIAALNLATTYAAIEHKHEIADVNGLSDAIAAAKKAGDDAAEALGTYKTLNDAAVKVNTDAITGIKNGETMNSFKAVEDALAGKQAVGDYATKTEAQGYANAKDAAIQAAQKAADDAAAAAAQALVDAKKYTDDEIAEWVGDKTVGTQIEEAIANYTTTTDMNTAIATAKGEAVGHADELNSAMNTRVLALEAIDHDHSNKAELDKIADGDVAKWNAAEGNAKAYADELDGAMDERVLALEAKFGDGEGNVEAQIEAAVAAEAALREAADAALQAQIGEASAEGKDATGLHARIEELEGLVGDDKVSEAIAAAVKVEEDRAKEIEADLEDRLAAVEADYLTSVEEKALQDQITANASAIELLTNGVKADEVDGVNDLIKYVKEHGTEVTGIKADIKANADAIGKATEGEAAGTGLYKRIEDAEVAIATKAAQTDLEDLDVRVDAVETELNTAETGLKARMTAAEADIDALETKVGDKTVAAQIEAAIEACKTDAANKDAVVLAEVTAAVEQHNTDKAALEAEIAKKANDAELAAIAKTGSTDDLVQGTMTLVFDCGGADV